MYSQYVFSLEKFAGGGRSKEKFAGGGRSKAGLREGRPLERGCQNIEGGVSDDRYIGK